MVIKISESDLIIQIVDLNHIGIWITLINLAAVKWIGQRDNIRSPVVTGLVVTAIDGHLRQEKFR